MSKEVYGRYELKYFLPHKNIKELLNWIEPYTKPDRHAELENGVPRYDIRSVYFDTLDLRLYYEKIDGLRDRKKFRIRAYKRPDNNTSVFLEIKYKFNTQVMKDRALFSLNDAKKMLVDRTYIDKLDLPIHIKKPAERFCYYFNKWNLTPIVTVNYDRVPFVGKSDSRVRLTIDTNMKFVDHRNVNDIFKPYIEQPVPMPGAILELKFDKYMPQWMRGLIQRFDIRQQAISKYTYCVDGAVFNKYEKI